MMFEAGARVIYYCTRINNGFPNGHDRFPALVEGTSKAKNGRLLYNIIANFKGTNHSLKVEDKALRHYSGVEFNTESHRLETAWRPKTEAKKPLPQTPRPQPAQEPKKEMKVKPPLAQASRPKAAQKPENKPLRKSLSKTSVVCGECRKAIRGHVTRNTWRQHMATEHPKKIAATSPNVPAISSWVRSS